MVLLKSSTVMFSYRSVFSSYTTVTLLPLPSGGVSMTVLAPVFSQLLGKAKDRYPSSNTWNPSGISGGGVELQAAKERAPPRTKSRASRARTIIFMVKSPFANARFEVYGVIIAHFTAIVNRHCSLRTPQKILLKNIVRKMPQISFWLLTKRKNCGIILEYPKLGCRQAVRHGTLTPASVGSNPAIPAKQNSAFARMRSFVCIIHFSLFIIHYSFVSHAEF